MQPNKNGRKYKSGKRASVLHLEGAWDPTLAPPYTRGMTRYQLLLAFVPSIIYKIGLTNAYPWREKGWLEDMKCEILSDKKKDEAGQRKKGLREGGMTKDTICKKSRMLTLTVCVQH